MKSVTAALRRLLLIVLFIALIGSVIYNYSFVFSKRIRGEVLEVERVSQTNTVVGGLPMTDAQMFSFAVMIKSFDGKIYSASSEDRQWAIAKKGYCVETRLFPYPPWDLQNDGTYFNARLLRPFECQSEAPPGWKPGLNQVAEHAPSPTPASTTVTPVASAAPAQATPSATPPATTDHGRN